MLTDPSPPALPMDLPEIPQPASATVTARSRRLEAVAANSKPPITSDTTMVLVDAAQILIDDRFGIDVAVLAKRYAAQIAEARQRLTAGEPQMAYPFVLRADDDRYIAFTEIPTAIAAMEMAGGLPGTNVMVTVIIRDAVDGEAMLASVFERQRNKSLYEKACYIAGCETKYRSRRAWMRAEGISAEKWEPRFSKVAKIGKLDRRLLAKIDPHTISNADIAGRIVDFWTDPDKRRIVMDMTEAAAVAADGLVNAGPLFKRIDAALGTTRPAFVPGVWDDGTRDLRDTEGALIATLKRDGAGWSITGGDLSGLTRSALSSAFDALKD